MTFIRMSADLRTKMAKTRALMTDTERERIAGMADVEDIKVYQAKSRVRRRIEEELTFDAELLEEHAPDLYQELVDAVCPDDSNSAASVDEQAPSPAEPASEPEPELEAPPVADPDVESDLEAAYREFLEDRPPKKRHSKNIVVDVLLLLREHEYLETGELQERVYADYEDHYSTERTMWNAVSRYLRDLPGFEKPDEYGGWAYAGDDAVWEAVRGE